MGLGMLEPSSRGFADLGEVDRWAGLDALWPGSANESPCPGVGFKHTNFSEVEKVLDQNGMKYVAMWRLDSVRFAWLVYQVKA